MQAVADVYNIHHPCPQTFNVELKYHELALRNFVRSRGLPSQSLRHANIELGGNGGSAKTVMYDQCTHARVANFCPSTVLSNRCCIEHCCDCSVHLKRRHGNVRSKPEQPEQLEQQERLDIVKTGMQAPQTTKQYKT